MPCIDQGNAINVRIDNVAKVEKVLKSELSILSREILEYIVVNDSNDIATVNRLLSVLTPMNRNASALYFKHFLFFKYDEETGLFTTKLKHDKQLDKKRALVADWLATDTNDLWVWADSNIEMKPLVRFEGRITALVEQALAGKEGKNGQEDLEPLSPMEILQAVMAAGISLDDTMTALSSLESPTVAIAA